MWSFVFAPLTSQPCGSGSQFQRATLNLNLAVVVELVEPVLQLVDVLFQSGHLGIHVGLLQGSDVVDLDGGWVDRRLRAVPGTDAGQELRPWPSSRPGCRCPAAPPGWRR